MLKLVAFGQSLAVVASDRARTFVRREEGQTMAEYAVVLAVVTVLVVGAIGLLSTGIAAKIAEVTGIVDKAGDPPAAPPAG